MFARNPAIFLFSSLAGKNNIPLWTKWKKKGKKDFSALLASQGGRDAETKGEDAASLVWSLVLTRGHPHPAQSGSRLEVMLSLIHKHALRMFCDPHATFFLF